MARKIAILGGTGAEGSGLAYRLAKAGEHILIGSRDATRAQETARLLRERIGSGAQVEGLDNPSAAGACDVAVLTVPFSGAAVLLKQLKNAWKPGTVVIDTTVPLAATAGGKPTRMLGVWQGSAAAQARELAPPDTQVLAAFHNVSAEVLNDLSAVPDCDVLVCGDDPAAKETLFPYVKLIPGLRPIDAGPLETARIVESLTALLISVNQRHRVKHSGIRITGLEHS